jgi:vacuolar protein sorting-associated protein 11
LNKLNKSTPACLRVVKTNLQKPMALGVSENGQCLAIGFERGNVSIYKGDVARDKSKTVRNLIFGTAAIRGIAFKQTGRVTQMFVCSDSGVFLFTIQGRDKEFKYTIDGRAPCYAFDGRKVLIRWFRSHLLMVTAPFHDNLFQQK